MCFSLRVPPFSLAPGHVLVCVFNVTEPESVQTGIAEEEQAVSHELWVFKGIFAEIFHRCHIVNCCTGHNYENN